MNINFAITIFYIVQIYVFRKKQQMGTTAKKMPAEKTLFHGTKQQFVDVICKDGFDWRIAGMSSGTAYGKGSYFARDSTYSSR